MLKQDYKPKHNNCKGINKVNVCVYYYYFKNIRITSRCIVFYFSYNCIRQGCGCGSAIFVEDAEGSNPCNPNPDLSQNQCQAQNNNKYNTKPWHNRLDITECIFAMCGVFKKSLYSLP